APEPGLGDLLAHRGGGGRALDQEEREAHERRGLGGPEEHARDAVEAAQQERAREALGDPAEERGDHPGADEDERPPERLRGHRLLLPSHARLLVVLALAQLGQDAGLLTLFLEAADRALDGLVLLDPYPSHAVDSPPPGASGTRVLASRSLRSKERTIR